MLFQAASPRPRMQLSSLSGEPRAPCFVSAHSPVPTLRIWMRKKQRGQVRCLEISSGAPAGVGGGRQSRGCQFVLDWWAGQNLLIREQREQLHSTLL